MAFAAHTGVNVNLDVLADDKEGLAAALFSEELGAVLQVRREDLEEVFAQFDAAGLADCTAVIGAPNEDGQVTFSFRDEEVLRDRKSTRLNSSHVRISY